MVLVELSGIFSHTKSVCFVLNAISVHCELADRASLGLWRSCTDLKVNFYRETMFQERHTLILKRYQMWTSSWMINYRLCEKQWSLKWLISVFISLQLSRILLRKVWMELLSKSSLVPSYQNRILNPYNSLFRTIHGMIFKIILGTLLLKPYLGSL